MSDVELIARFLSRQAHDIRNCSGLLQLNLQMLGAEVQSDRGKACIDDGNEAVRRLDAIANRLSHALNPPSAPVEATDVRALAGDCFAAAQQRRVQEGVFFLDVDFQVDGDGTLETSPAFLRCALDAVFDNAMDALETLPSQGRLRVTIEPFSVRVSNSGPPVPSTEAIFQPFVAWPHHDRFRAGLGLTRVSRFATRVGAEIACENHDDGPVFVIHCPPTP